MYVSQPSALAGSVNSSWLMAAMRLCLGCMGPGFETCLIFALYGDEHFALVRCVFQLVTLLALFVVLSGRRQI
jgi:hypothetical protein